MKTRKAAKKRKRNRQQRAPHWFVSAMSGVVVCSTVGTVAPPAFAFQAIHESNPTQTVEIQTFDIAPALLDVVLEFFTKVTGLEVHITRSGLAALPSPGVRGRYSAEQALRQILAGTGITFRRTSLSAVSLDLSTLSESVDVTAVAPAVNTTSPKYTEPLRDIPQTITVIPQAIIQQQGATTLREVLRNVTGISIQAGEGGVPAGDNLSIRGFNARTDMFVDGVRDFGAYSRDPFNVEQIEVSKGPSSAYVGRGSTGGSINMASKSPQLTAARSGSFSGGTSAYRRATLDINQPIQSIKGAAFRFAGMVTDAETPGRDAVENRRWGLAPSLAFGLHARTKALFSYMHMDQENVPDYGLPWVPNTNTALVPYQDQAPPVSFNNFYGLVTRDFEKTFTRMGSGEFRHDFNGSLGIRSIVRHGRTKRDSVITAPRFLTTTGTSLNRQFQSRDQTDAITASQTNLTAFSKQGAIEHSIVAGIEFARETSENFARTAPAAPAADLYNPNPNEAFSGAISRTGAVNKSVADTAAVYAGDTLKLSEHWQVSGSLRWDNFKMDYKSVAVNGPVSPFERTDKLLSGRVGIVYKPQETGSLYFGYGTSLNPSAEGFSLSTSTTDLKPERNRSYEAGIKWDFYSGRLSLNSAYFRTEKTNARTPGINPGDPPTVLDGVQHVDGVEFGIMGNISPRWQTIGGYTFMRSKIDRSNNALEVGREFGNTPRHSFNLWTNYQFPWSFDIGGGATYTGDLLNSTTANRIAPGYWTVDATAAYYVNERVSLRLNGTNLTNERYIDRVGGGHFVPGSGRLAMLTLDFKF